MKKNVHVVPHQNGWAVKTARSEKAVKVTETQKKAIVIGKSVAQNQKSELVIHRPNGRIRDKDSYGNDPNPPKDKKY